MNDTLWEILLWTIAIVVVAVLAIGRIMKDR